MAAWEQATRDQMRIVSKAKDDADDWADLWRGRPRGFDALGLPIPARRLGAKRLLIATGIRAGWLSLRANLAAAILRHNRPTRAFCEPAGMITPRDVPSPCGPALTWTTM